MIAGCVCIYLLPQIRADWPGCEFRALLAAHAALFSNYVSESRYFESFNFLHQSCQCVYIYSPSGYAYRHLSHSFAAAVYMNCCRHEQLVILYIYILYDLPGCD